MLKYLVHILLLIAPFLSICQSFQGKKYFESDSSRIREIFHYSADDSLLEGSYESFHINGSLQTFGWYKDDLPDSIWFYYYENGRTKAEGRYEKGVANGRWTYYYENGNIKSNGFLKEKIKEGNWTFYFENGGEKNAGTYENDEKVGIWNYFYEDGSIKAQVGYQGSTGKYQEFYPFGGIKQEGDLIQDKSEGEWVYYYETGEMEAIGTFQKGMKTGFWKYFHKNGEKKATGTYENGKKDGEWNFYHENGQISESGTINLEQKEGYWKLFYPSGEVKGEIRFDEGSGLFKEYYLSGRIKSEGQIINEKKEGPWVYYSEDGQLEGKAVFENGEGNYTGYYPDGSLKIKGKMKDDKRVGEWTLYNPDGTVAGTYTPIYENEKPVFKTRLSRDVGPEKKDTRFEKPQYKYKKRGIRYFNSRINEYRALILGTNPVWLADNQLPIALEYYMQERLGYEMQLDLLRDPFFSNGNLNYELYSNGLRFNFRQKLYHEDGRYGMFYFGHQASYTTINYQVNHLDTLIFPAFPKFGEMVETRFAYGLFIGNRWMRDVGDSGLTIDAFLGIQIANRRYSRKFETDPVLDVYFDPLIDSSLFFPIIFGVNIGFASPDNKSKTQ